MCPPAIAPITARPIVNPEKRVAARTYSCRVLALVRATIEVALVATAIRTAVQPFNGSSEVIT